MPAHQLYPAFIEHVARQLSELEQDARRFNLSLREVPRTIGRNQNSLIKLADEYAWVTVTLGHRIPDCEQLELLVALVPLTMWCLASPGSKGE